MSKVSVLDLANVRLTVSDLDKSRQFSEAFGLVTVEQTANAVYSRSTDAGSFCHVVTLGEPAFIGAAFHVASVEALQAATTIEGASQIEPTNEPGGGLRVRLHDPDGFQIELLHGVEIMPALHVEKYPVNTAFARERPNGTFYRRPPGAARVKRIGHFVTSTPDVKRTRDWYRETLGLIGTDDVFADAEDNVIATFNRLPRGKEFVDHHVFMTHKAPAPGLNHFGFEVQDYDDIFFGHFHMKESGLNHRWGTGRHRLGSQVFNQWSDPWGRGYEHWTDTDFLNEDAPFTNVPASEAMKAQWGDPAPTQLGGPKH